MRRRGRCWRICIAGALIAACRLPAPSPTPPRAPVEPLQDPVRLEPFVIRAMPEARDSAEVAIDAYDAGALFGRAAAAYREERYRNASRLFQQVAAEFPGSEYASPALYNAGLALERQNDFQNAATMYLNLVDAYPDAPDVTDALFRLTGAYEALEMWPAAAAVLTRLLTERTDLEAIERVECLARRGAALLSLNRPHEAREDLNKAVMFFRSGSGISPTAPTFFYAMARFKIGEIIEGEMVSVALPADEDQLEAALEQKCRLLLLAQTAYTDAIRVTHPHWAAAAAYRIGRLYRILWDEMMSAPPPPDLTEEEREIYLEVLRDRIRVLLEKAVRQWERVLSMADRLSLSNEWVARTKADLADIRALLAAGSDRGPESNASDHEKKVSPE